MTNDLTLEDLATISGLPLRTLRFYMQEGILQSPDTRGKYARYSREHLERLELILRLKNLRIPLQEIKELLFSMTPQEINQVRSYQYIQNLNTNRVKVKEETGSSGMRSSALEYIQDLQRGRLNVQSMTRSQGKKLNAMQVPDILAPAPSMPRIKIKMQEETWKRIVLDEGIELNIREPQDMDQERKINELIEFARKLFESQSQEGENQWKRTSK